MKIEIHDTTLEARIQRQIQATGSDSVEEALSDSLRRRKSRTAGFWRIGQ